MLTQKQQGQLQDAYLIELVASKFSEKIRRWLTVDELKEANDKNQTEAYKNCCATHDYLDANVYMMEAFFEVTKSEDYFSEMSTDLMNKAWDRAKADQFKPIL